MQTQIGVPDGDFFPFLDLPLSPYCCLYACDPVLTVRNTGVRRQAKVGEEGLDGVVNAD